MLIRVVQCAAGCVWPSDAPRWQWRGQESNLRPPGYEPGDLPLIYPAERPKTGKEPGPRRRKDGRARDVSLGGQAPGRPHAFGLS